MLGRLSLVLLLATSVCPSAVHRRFARRRAGDEHSKAACHRHFRRRRDREHGERWCRRHGAGLCRRAHQRRRPTRALGLDGLGDSVDYERLAMQRQRRRCRLLVLGRRGSLQRHAQLSAALGELGDESVLLALRQLGPRQRQPLHLKLRPRVRELGVPARDLALECLDLGQERVEIRLAPLADAHPQVLVRLPYDPREQQEHRSPGVGSAATLAGLQALPPLLPGRVEPRRRRQQR